MIGDVKPLALINGVQAEPADPVVGARDDGLLRGDGAFEVIRLYDGQPFAVREHIERLKTSSRALELELHEETIAAELAQFCSLAENRSMYVRIVVTREGIRLLVEEPLLAYPARMRLLPIAHEIPPLLRGVKSLSYAAHAKAKRLAQAADCDDALFVSATTGRVLEGPFTSFCWSRAGRIFTPPLEEGILDSITRRILLEVADAEEVPTAQDDLRTASGACVLGTGPEALPVAEVRGLASFPATDPVIASAATRVRERIQERMKKAGG